MIVAELEALLARLPGDLPVHICTDGYGAYHLDWLDRRTPLHFRDGKVYPSALVLRGGTRWDCEAPVGRLSGPWGKRDRRSDREVVLAFHALAGRTVAS